MAVWYVDSNVVGGAENGSSWANAELSLKNLVAGESGSMADGDVILMDDSHNAGYSADPATTIPISCRIVSVDKADNTYSAGADERVSSANCTWTATANKIVQWEGVSVGVKSATYDLYLAGNTVTWRFIDGLIEVDQAGNSVHVQGGGWVECVKPAIYAANDTNGDVFVLAQASGLHLKNCTFPNSLTNNMRLVASGNTQAFRPVVLVEDCDLNEFQTILVVGNLQKPDGTLRRCRLRSGVTLISGTDVPLDGIKCEYCSTAALTATPLSLYKLESPAGTVETVATQFRVEGAYDGENEYCYKLSPSSGCSQLDPLVVPDDLLKWADSQHPKRLIIYIASNDAYLRDDEVWAEVSWNDEAATPYATGEFISTRGNYGDGEPKNRSAYLKSSGASWNILGSYTPYEIVIPDINPKEPGPLVARVFFADPLRTLWVCPLMSLEYE